MATTKRNTKGRTVATRVKASARGAKSAKPTASKKATKAAARPTAKTKLARKTSAKPSAGAKRSAPPKRAAVTKPVGDSREVVALKAKFQRERNALQKSLTEAVREIGLLRHHELRATHFERQVAERDATIARLQAQLADLERRPAEPVHVREVQQTLALGVVATSEEATDLDEFEDDRLPEEADVIADDE